MAKKSQYQITTTLPQLISDLKFDENKIHMAVLDTESTTSRMIFDFAYAINTPREGLQGIPKGTLVYEALKDSFLYDEISKWNKVKNATENQTYSIINKLHNSDWFSKTHSPAEIAQIQKELTTSVAINVLEKTRKLTVLANDISFRGEWNNETGSRRKFEGSKYTRELYEQSLINASEVDKGAIMLKRYIEYQDNVEHLIKNKIVAENDYHLQRKLGKLYYDRYTKMKLTPSEKEMREDLATVKTMLHGDQVESWGTIMKEFESTLDGYKDSLLGISAYSIQNDRSFIRQTSDKYGFPTYRNVLDKYREVCLEAMYKQLRRMKPEDIANMLDGENPDAIAKGYRVALRNSGKSAKASFTVAYNNEFDAKNRGFKAQHTAPGDVFDESRLSNLLIKELGDILKSKK